MIIRTKGGRDLELYSSFALTDMARYGYQGLRSLTARFGEREMRGIPAIHRAARMRAEAVAQLRLYCWRGEGPTRDRIDTPWQAKLFRGNPNPVQTRFGFWETVEESLSYRGNAYIWKTVAGGRIGEWWALHPDQVEAKEGGSYAVTVATGYVDPVGKGPGKYTVDTSTILHIRGHGQGGQLVAPSPVEVFRDALAGPVGRQRHEARMWRRGTALQVAIEFPATVTKDQADMWREGWRANYEGTEGDTTAVIGGGGQIKPIGMTATDSAFVDLAQLTVQDASRMMGVPANLLGYSILQRGTANLEQETMTWLRFGLGPELERIESALAADPDLFGIGAKLSAETSGSLGLYPAFDTDEFVRGDIATEATVLTQRVQSGVITPNEARKQLGLAPDSDPNSDKLQVTPVGGKPNPNMPSNPIPQGGTDE